MRGRFITLEGVDGAGKSTHLQGLAQQLRERGIEVVQTREPGGSPLAEKLRTLLLDEEMPATAELLLVFAARADHLRHTIEPALARGAFVLCDRFTDSTRAYQGAGRGMDAALIESLAGQVHPHCNPDRTYLFDLAPEAARARRVRVRGADRFEREEQDFFERVRAGYLEIVQREADRFCVIDAAQSVAGIGARIRDDLNAWLDHD